MCKGQSNNSFFLEKAMNYEKLQGTGTDGNFVLEGQTLATKEGFGHVSKKWYDQTMSYDEGLEKLAVGRQHTDDITSTLSRFTPSVDENGNFVMVHGDRKFRPTGHALGQMGVWAKTGTWYPRSLTEDVYDNKDRVKFQRDPQDVLLEFFAMHFVVLTKIRNSFSEPVTMVHCVQCCLIVMLLWTTHGSSM
jgi:hypothetical protein